MRDTSVLRFFGGFCFSLCGCRHEGDESVTDGALHGVLRSTVESDAIDHHANDDVPPDELAHYAICERRKATNAWPGGEAVPEFYFCNFELPDECSEMRGRGRREGVVLVLEALPDCQEPDPSVASGITRFRGGLRNPTRMPQI